jgi:hypothetical protein
MTRLERIVIATLALMGAGSVFGALTGAVALTISAMASLRPFPLGAPIIGAVLGAGFGAATAPLVGWALLRRAPLGRMFVECAVGSTLGGIAGWLLAFSILPPLGGLAGAYAGCLAAALRLRHETMRRLEA